MADGISLANLRAARKTYLRFELTLPPPPTTPNLPFEQAASTSRSQRRVESKSQGGEADDNDSKDVDVHRPHVVPQNPESTRQTAINKATDTTNPNATSIGLTMPVGKLHELQTKSDENEKGEKGGEAEKGENDDNGG
ncbi:hypothetical protein PAXINDRAFT_13449 [Paxillus involutus ATCC 200175]|uniref:Uncharacterized protein n=1 Tax=Paxillus involutus ATCC 200175 TaxID=664439 RepID=A0A0C9TTZ8_PAXIN|nr:hypothetical protein PAXINDRAFT_13449 [Paxillus involutus ATCC 200175]